jgi:hypothetical protein
MKTQFGLLARIRIRRLRHAAAFGLSGAACLLAPMVTHAAPDLRASALTAHDAPPGFTTPHVKVYSAFTDEMAVTVHGPSGSVSTTCLMSGTTARAGWAQGLVEGFDTTVLTSHLRVCGLVLKSSGQAAAFYTDEAGNVASHIKIGLETALPAHIGDLSTAGKSNHSYEIVFRKGTAVIEIDYASYSGKPIAAARFLKLARTMSARIH